MDVKSKADDFNKDLHICQCIASSRNTAQCNACGQSHHLGFSSHTPKKHTKKKKKRLVSDLNNTKPMSRSNLLIYLQKISISQSGHLIFEKWLHTFWIARLLEVLLWINNFIVSPEMITKRKKKS